MCQSTCNLPRRGWCLLALYCSATLGTSYLFFPVARLFEYGCQRLSRFRVVEVAKGILAFFKKWTNSIKEGCNRVYWVCGFIHSYSKLILSLLGKHSFRPTFGLPRRGRCLLAPYCSATRGTSYSFCPLKGTNWSIEMISIFVFLIFRLFAKHGLNE